MRLLIDLRLLSKGGISGIEEYTRNLLQSLLAYDQVNDYTLFYNGFQKEPLGSHLSSVIGHRSRLVDWHIPNKILDFSSRFLRRPAIDKFIQSDVIFSPHFNLLSVKNIPRVITFHDLSFLHHPDFFSFKQKFWHWLQDIKKQAQEAAKIIAVSEFTKSDLVNLLKVPPEKIQVVYSGISDEFRSNIGSSQDLRSCEDLKIERRPFILYLGAIEPRKNIPALIRAFSILKQNSAFGDFQLVLAGRPGWLYRDILKEAGQSSYREDIIFKGPVSKERRVLLYNSAKVFVYPSFFEGFGFPPLEAQACGCPVIVADRTSLPEVVGESAIKINPWKIDELAGAIGKVLSDTELRQRLISAGLNNAKMFNWTDTANRTLKVLESALL